MEKLSILHRVFFSIAQVLAYGGDKKTGLLSDILYSLPYFFLFLVILESNCAISFGAQGGSWETHNPKDTAK